MKLDHIMIECVHSIRQHKYAKGTQYLALGGNLHVPSTNVLHLPQKGFHVPWSKGEGWTMIQLEKK